MTAIVTFKEWLPDQPELGNPGLTVAQNIVPLASGYGPYHPLDGAYGTAPASVIEAYVANGSTKGSSTVYLKAGSRYYAANDSGPGFATLGSLTAAEGGFAQYENMVFSADGSEHRIARVSIGATAGSASMAAITSAPYADVLGVVGQFLIAGGLYDDAAPSTSGATRSNYIQWPAIDDPENWPPPGSATAIASQAGEQALYEQYGPVYGISNGDQFGLIFQRGAITRMTYIGGSSVFQFDVIDATRGMYYKRGMVQVGGVVYFISASGFCRTDGVSVESIGAGRVDKQWLAATAGSVVTCAFDPVDEVVHFGNGHRVFMYSPRADKWTDAEQLHTYLLTPAPNLGFRQHVLGYDTASPPLFGQMAATAGTAIIRTGESELQQYGRAFVSGVRPLVEHDATAPSVSCRVGYRDSLAAAPSWAATTSPNARTGEANFRVDAKYHRFEVQIAGEFQRAVGLEFDAVPAGKA
jgi:hypothetical protein